jgi:hypothetical protein
MVHPLEPGISAGVDKEIGVLSQRSRAGQDPKSKSNHQTEHGSDWFHEDIDLLDYEKAVANAA